MRRTKDVLALTARLLAAIALLATFFGTSARAQTYLDAARSPEGVISLPHELTPEEMLRSEERRVGKEC